MVWTENNMIFLQQQSINPVWKESYNFPSLAVLTSISYKLTTNKCIDHERINIELNFNKKHLSK